MHTVCLLQIAKVQHLYTDSVRCLQGVALSYSYMSEQRLAEK